MTHGFRIHKQLQEIIAEIKRIEHTSEHINEDYKELLEKRAERLQRKFRSYHGFNYHPLMYEGEQR